MPPWVGKSLARCLRQWNHCAVGEDYVFSCHWQWWKHRCCCKTHGTWITAQPQNSGLPVVWVLLRVNFGKSLSAENLTEKHLKQNKTKQVSSWLAGGPNKRRFFIRFISRLNNNGGKRRNKNSLFTYYQLELVPASLMLMREITPRVLVKSSANHISVIVWVRHIQVQRN